MGLRDSQQTIADWIRAPEGVAAALLEEDAASEGAEPGDASRRLAKLIRSDSNLDATGRLEIYANAYFSRILGVLSSDYPALSKAIGANAFNDLVTSYLLVEPSRHPSLRYAGARLASVVASHEVTARFREKFVWAANLAELEWARVDVFDVADGDALTRGSLASLSPEAFGSLELRIGPWALLRRFAYSVDRIWALAVREERELSPADRTAAEVEEEVCVLVWRKEEAVLHRRVDQIEADALDRLRQGIDFEGLCEWVATQIGEDEAPARAAGWLETWLAEGLLIEPQGSAGSDSSDQ